MKKLLIILLLLLGNSLLDSCATDDLFDFSLDLTEAGNFSMATYSALDPGTAIAANDYAILVEGNSTILLSQTNPSFGGRLLADAAYELDDKVTNISITSNTNLNDNYPAGNELKALFAPQEIASHCMSNPGVADDCLYDYSVNSIEEAFNEKMAVGFVERGGEGGGVRLFALRTNEAIVSQSHVFTVRFDFQSGKSTELIAEAITFE